MPGAKQPVAKKLGGILAAVQTGVKKGIQEAKGLVRRAASAPRARSPRKGEDLETVMTSAYTTAIQLCNLVIATAEPKAYPRHARTLYCGGINTKSQHERWLVAAPKCDNLNLEPADLRRLQVAAVTLNKTMASLLKRATKRTKTAPTGEEESYFHDKILGYLKSSEDAHKAFVAVVTEVAPIALKRFMRGKSFGDQVRQQHGVPPSPEGASAATAAEAAVRAVMAGGGDRSPLLPGSRAGSRRPSGASSTGGAPSNADYKHQRQVSFQDAPSAPSSRRHSATGDSSSNAGATASSLPPRGAQPAGSSGRQANGHSPLKHAVPIGTAAAGGAAWAASSNAVDLDMSEPALAEAQAAAEAGDVEGTPPDRW